jgi:uncharacterized protein (TIGR03437 family)
MNGYKDADVLYAGASPGLVAGATQINFRVPTDLFAGSVGVQIQASGVLSSSANIFLKQ